MQSPPPPSYLPNQPVYSVQPGTYMSMDNSMAQNYGNGHMNITVQPGVVAPMAPGTITMPVPPPIEGVPPGLEYLTMVDQIFVHQLYEILELLSSWECSNKYVLKNANGQQVYFAAEESGCCERQWCHNRRGWKIHIVDNFKREVMTINRPLKCFGGCCWFASVPCCAHECTIESPPGNVIGAVVQKFAGCSSAFYVKDANDQTIFEIAGLCCCLLCGCQDKEFPVLTARGEQIGAVTKKWGGCLRETIANADIFSVTFPLDLDVKMKAILIGATFLIDYMEFEEVKNNTNACFNG